MAMKKIAPPKKNAVKSKLRSASNPGINGFPAVPGWYLWAVIIFAFLVYFRALFNDFVYLDDDQYILTNPFIRDFSVKGLSAVFSTFYFSNYHPLTTLTYMFEYALYGLNPFPYHLFNVLLHLLNIFIVYKLVEKLSGKQITALVVALFFAVHPMHVESVAWVSERKDVLYAVFFSWSLLLYLRYIETGNEKRMKYYYGALVVFLFSLLSKPAAVTLPLLMIAIDVYKGRKINAKVLLEKVPFFLLSLFFGIITILAQKAGGAIKDVSSTYSMVERLFILSYSVAFYIVKLVIPVNLSAMYYYPDTRGGALPWQFYASLPFILGVGWLLIKNKSLRKETIFGVVFFLVAISVMLQFVTFGYALTAERYTYIAYIGLFYIAGQFISKISDKGNLRLAAGLLCIVALLFSIQTWNRIGIWKNGDVLIDDVVSKNPDNFNGYWTRANLKNTKGDLQGALMDFNKVVEFRPDFALGLKMRGEVQNKLGNFEGAVQDLNRAIVMQPDMVEAYNLRGNAFYGLGNFQLAMVDCNKAISLNPKLVEAYTNRCMLKAMSGDTAGALADVNQAIGIDPGNAGAYSSRANIRVMMKNFEGALEDFNYSIKLNPGNSMVYFNRGISRLNLKDTLGACEDWHKVSAMGNNSAEGLISNYCH